MKTVTVEQLNRWKTQIETAKQEIAEIKGQQKSIMKRLADEFDCKSIKQAEKLLQQLDVELLADKEKIENKVKELEELYDFD